MSRVGDSDSTVHALPLRHPAFRKAAIAFALELEGRQSEVAADALTGEALAGFAHQLYGAAGLFQARQTEAAARALERAVKEQCDPAVLAELRLALAAAMCADGAALRHRIDAAGAGAESGPPTDPHE